MKNAAKIGVVAVVVAVGFVVGQTLPTLGGEGAEGGAEQLDISDARELLSENLEGVREQQADERAVAEADLSLPGGAQLRAPETFGDLVAQIEGLAASDDANAGNIGTDEVTLREYEEGYFASVVALDWQCAWLSEAARASAAGDSIGMEVAVEQLRGFAQTEYA